MVYATLLSAFYLPVIVMLLGLILRGMAFEFRDQNPRTRWVWDLSFAGGSLVATFATGRDGRRPCGRVAIHEWPIFRWSILLVYHVLGLVWNRALSWLCAAWRLLAGPEM